MKEEGNDVRNALVGMRELMCLGIVGGRKRGTVAPYAADLR